MTQSSTLILARAYGAGATLASPAGRFVVDNWSPGTGDVYGFPVDEAGARGPLQRLPDDLAEPFETRAEFMALRYPARISTEEQKAIGTARHRAFYARCVSPADLEAVRRNIGMARLLASRDPNLNDIPVARWDGIAAPLQSQHRARLKALGDFYSMAGGLCILKEAARQLIEAERASATGGEG